MGMECKQAAGRREADVEIDAMKVSRGAKFDRGKNLKRIK
jgi:hypothetical protein